MCVAGSVSNASSSVLTNTRPHKGQGRAGPHCIPGFLQGPGTPRAWTPQNRIWLTSEGPERLSSFPHTDLVGWPQSSGGLKGVFWEKYTSVQRLEGLGNKAASHVAKPHEECKIPVRSVPQPCDKPLISTRSHLSTGRAGSRVIRLCQGQILESTRKNSSLIFCHTSWRHAMDSSDSLILKLRYSFLKKILFIYLFSCDGS